MRRQARGGKFPKIGLSSAAVRSFILFAVLASLLGLACARIDDAVGVRPRDAGFQDSDPCHVDWSVGLQPRPADVLIILDRSGSMNLAFGSSSRYQGVATVLSNLVKSYDNHIRFGYQEMPGRVDCEGQTASCCASPPMVDLAIGNAQAMVAAISQAGPVEGSTPTAAALLQARAYYDALDDGIDNRYVLLATDGVPSCTLSGALSDGTSSTSAACLDALAEVQALVASGVKVLVLAVGAEAASITGQSSCLDQLAHAGGAALSPGSPGYYSGEDPERLQSAIEEIFGAVSQPSCVFDMDKIHDPTLVALYLDGQEIPRTGSGDGWHWEEKTTSSQLAIRVTGAYCRSIQDYKVDGFRLDYGCPATCIDLLQCRP